MGLTTCLDRGMEISDQVAACPKCAPAAPSNASRDRQDSIVLEPSG